MFARKTAVCLVTMLMGSALVACDSIASSTSLAIAQPCRIVEGTPRPLTGVIPRLVDQTTSPSYCSAASVQTDFALAIDWYQHQVEYMQTTRTYRPAMMDELAFYYTGKLLLEARETIYYNQQARRVVIGRWNELSVNPEPIWSRDGLYATLLVRALGYERVMLTAATSEENHVGSGSVFENWKVTLMYDAVDQRWKIQSVEGQFDF